MELSSRGGRVNGIAQWIALDMDGNDRYENAPSPERDSAWGVLFYPFARPIDTAPGEFLTVSGAHDRVSLRVWGEIRTR